MAVQFGVKNQWNLALNIGGKDFPADTSNVQQLLWYENIHQNLPTLNLTLVDKTGVFSNITAAGDGVKIEATIGDGEARGETSGVFSIQGPPQISHGSGYNVIKLNAVLDYVPYQRSIASGLLEGTSSQVIAQLASKVGLKFSGDDTADSMVWLPTNKTIASFIRHVSNHGWADAGSLMMAAITDQGKLLYKNVMQAKMSKETFGVAGNQDLQIIDWQASSNGMITNNNRGYGSTSFGFDIEGNVKELGKITFNMVSNILPIAAASVEAIGTLGGRLDSLIRSAGNTHEKYEEAAHQNQRLRALFSSDLNILTHAHTATELLQSAFASPIDWSTGKPNAALTGNYILSGRTKTITRSRYEERLVLTGMGGN